MKLRVITLILSAWILSVSPAIAITWLTPSVTRHDTFVVTFRHGGTVAAHCAHETTSHTGQYTDYIGSNCLSINGG